MFIRFANKIINAGNFNFSNERNYVIDATNSNSANCESLQEDFTCAELRDKRFAELEKMLCSNPIADAINDFNDRYSGIQGVLASH